MKYKKYNINQSIRGLNIEAINLNGEAGHDSSANAAAETTFLADEDPNSDFRARHAA